MKLLQLIQKYEDDREVYIRYLEKENDTLRARLSKAVDDGVKSAELCSSMVLKAALAGAFPRPAAATDDEDVASPTGSEDPR